MSEPSQPVQGPRPPGPPTRFGPYAALSVVVANMIGTGVFTSLGFQLLDITSPFALLMLWVVGGVAAFCGALTYAELGAALPRSGGEYTFLGRIYHPAAGFISGWVSASIGFAAPTALAAITFGTYVRSVVPAANAALLASALVVIFTVVHASTRRNSSTVQSVFTTFKVLLILTFCVAAWTLTPSPQPVPLLPDAAGLSALTSGAFAVSLIYVSYAYTGWNAATYLTSELERPQRTLPWILGLGTGLVLVLYVALNHAFLYAAPQADLVGKLEVGYVAATHTFGARGGEIMGLVLAALLVSTVSAMVLAGPRVLQVIGEDYHLFRFLARTNRDGIPWAAIATQGAVSVLFILTGSFESILVFAGFTLGLNSFFTVLGVFVLRWRQPDLERPYRTWGYPVTPLVYLSLTLWTLAFLLVDRPQEAGLGLAIVASGGLLYRLTGRPAKVSKDGA
ncbi:MAG: amino acid permease [Gemmatimonadota bacterium]